MLANEVQMTAKKTTQPKAGRPTKFRKEFIEQARKLCLIGATDDQVADFLGVDPRTIYRWKNENEEFCKALRSARKKLMRAWCAAFISERWAMNMKT